MSEKTWQELFRKYWKVPSFFDSKELKTNNYSILSYGGDPITRPTCWMISFKRLTEPVWVWAWRRNALDQRIIEWAAQLPLEYKYNRSVEIHSKTDRFINTCLNQWWTGLKWALESYFGLVAKNPETFVDRYFDDSSSGNKCFSITI